MAISATITKSRFGTSHDSAYIKIIKITTDYLTKKSCSYMGVYDSVSAYLDGAQPMYIEKLDYDQEHVEENWGKPEEATPPREMAYRASRDKIKNIADYSNIVNIYDHDFEGGGKLTEEEVEELQNLKAMLSDIEENLESSELHLAAEQQRLTAITSKLESINNEVEALKSNHINKKVEIEAIEEDLREKLDKMKSLKEKAEETNSAEDIKAVKDYDAVLAAAEKDFQEKDDELKVLTKQLDDITRAKDEITHMSVESNELIKKINEEVNDSKKEKDHVEKLYGSLIAKDATAKFIESSMEKEKEQKELEELKQEKEEQIAKVMEGK